MVSLNHGCGIASDGYRLDHVGIQRALGQELGLADATCRRFENIDKRFADDFSLTFRVGHSLEFANKKLCGIFVVELNLEMLPKHVPHHLSFASAKDAIVDENAGELLSN